MQIYKPKFLRTILRNGRAFIALDTFICLFACLIYFYLLNKKRRLKLRVRRQPGLGVGRPEFDYVPDSGVLGREQRGWPVSEPPIVIVTMRNK